MQLDALLFGIDGLRLEPSRDRAVRGELPGDATGVSARAITGVTADSRAVRPGFVFVAVIGQQHDGHEHVAAAVRAGAAAVVLEAGSPRARAAQQQAHEADAAVILAESSRRALGLLAARFLGHPAEKLRFCGVTGTNGKTTTTYLVEAILRADGRRPAVVGTLGPRFEDRRWPVTHTTPDGPALHALFAELVALGATDVVMEVSSHALEQERVVGLRYAAAGFSNLTRDHLDFHGSMEAYFAAKRRLFVELTGPSGGAEVVNVDDPAGAELATARRQAGARLLTVSTGLCESGPWGSQVDVTVEQAEISAQGIAATLRTPLGRLALRSPLVGTFNLANLALATGLAIGLGASTTAIVGGLGAARGAPGRLERVPDPRGVLVAVDYAHTPDALLRVLEALRPLTRGKLVCVMGCGGDRDPGKRPIMGRIAAEHADRVLVTSDNPRTEDPAAIVAAIEAGIAPLGLAAVAPDRLAATDRGYAVEVDRRRAIFAALAGARAGDTVLIAGKGHEDYQIIGTQKRPFDDRRVAAEAIAAAAGLPDAVASDSADDPASGGRALPEEVRR